MVDYLAVTLNKQAQNCSCVRSPMRGSSSSLTSMMISSKANRLMGVSRRRRWKNGLLISLAPPSIVIEMKTVIGTGPAVGVGSGSFCMRWSIQVPTINTQHVALILNFGGGGWGGVKAFRKLPLETSWNVKMLNRLDINCCISVHVWRDDFLYQDQQFSLLSKNSTLWIPANG